MRCGVNPWVGEIPWRRKWQPTPVFLLRKFHKQRSLAGCSPRGGKVSDTNLVIKQQLVQELATHSSTPAWKIPCMEELQRLGHNWATSLSFYNSFWRRKWQRGLVGYSLWGCKELDTTKQLTHTHTHSPVWPHFYFIASSKTLFPNKVLSQVWRVRTWTYLFGGHSSTHMMGMMWSKSGVRVISEKGKMAGDEKVFWGKNQSFLLTWLWGMKRRWRQFWALCVCKWEKKKPAYYLVSAW